MHYFFYSLIKFIVALSLVVVGTTSLFIPWSENMRKALAQFILEDSLAIFLFGFAILVIGLVAIGNILIHARHTHYVLESEEGNIIIDDSVIQQQLNFYLKQLFPTSDIPAYVALKSNQIYVSIEFPYCPFIEQKLLLEKVKKELTALFSSTLGYNKGFRLSASFHPSSKQ